MSRLGKAKYGPLLLIWAQAGVSPVCSIAGSCLAYPHVLLAAALSGAGFSSFFYLKAVRIPLRRANPCHTSPRAISLSAEQPLVFLRVIVAEEP